MYRTRQSRHMLWVHPPRVKRPTRCREGCVQVALAQLKTARSATGGSRDASRDDPGSAFPVVARIREMGEESGLPPPYRAYGAAALSAPPQGGGAALARQRSALLSPDPQHPRKLLAPRAHREPPRITNRREAEALQVAAPRSEASLAGSTTKASSHQALSMPRTPAQRDGAPRGPEVTPGTRPASERC